MQTEFVDFIHSRMEQVEIQPQKDTRIKDWQARYEQEYKALLPLLKNRDLLRWRIDLILEILRHQQDVEKEIWYSTGFVDGIVLKHRVESLTGPLPRD